MTLAYDIHELAPYINWVYFFYAWQVKDEKEKSRLRQEAETLLTQWEGHYHAYALFELFETHADGDDIVVYKGVRSQESGVCRIPCLRQQQGEPPYLCLSDFIIPAYALTCNLSPLSISPDSSLLSPDSSIFHFDFYRIKKLEEVYDMGFEDYFYSGSLCLIEWPELIEEVLPDDAVKVTITEQPDGSRTVSF